MDPNSTRGKVPQGVQARIRFEHVHFYYPILRDTVLHRLVVFVQLSTYVSLICVAVYGTRPPPADWEVLWPRTEIIGARVASPYPTTIFVADMLLRFSEHPFPDVNVSSYRKCFSFSLILRASDPNSCRIRLRGCIKATVPWNSYCVCLTTSDTSRQKSLQLSWG